MARFREPQCEHQLQLEAVKPSQPALPALRVGGNNAMLTDALGITDVQRSRVNEADARTRSIAAL